MDLKETENLDLGLLESLLVGHMEPDIKILKTVFSNLFLPLKFLCLGSKTVKIII
jgi:hypothetical protein